MMPKLYAVRTEKLSSSGRFMRFAKETKEILSEAKQFFLASFLWTRPVWSLHFFWLTGEHFAICQGVQRGQEECQCKLAAKVA